MANHTPFYATSEDLRSTLNSVEAERALQYVPAGLFDHPEYAAFTSSAQIEPLGQSIKGSTVGGPRFLVADADVVIKVREVRQRRGGMRYAIDQLANPATVVLVPGGLYSDQVLIMGELSTVSEDERSTKLFRRLSDMMKKGFNKIDGTLVGPGAAKLWKTGVRLTADVRSPKEYDLSL